MVRILSKIVSDQIIHFAKASYDRKAVACPQEGIPTYRGPQVIREAKPGSRSASASEGKGKGVEGREGRGAPGKSTNVPHEAQVYPDNRVKRKVQAIKEKRTKKEEKERYEKMAEKMHRKRVERLKRKEKRNKLINS